MARRRMLVVLALAVTAAAVTSAAGPCASGVELQPVATGLSQPLLITHAGDGSGRLFIVEQVGTIKVLTPGSTPTVFLDIASRILAGGERGLLGLAFHPQYASNGRFFVDYTRAGDGATVVAEYHVSSDANVADPAETVLLTVPQPYSNHNGGMVAFGPDGDLYIGLGDGGFANDPENRAQDVGTLLGKILRIDVDSPGPSLPYSTPADNPFAGAVPGRDEIYALGLRNPWRFSFDRLTGQLWVGDVGQGKNEEIDIVTNGGNYGWRVMEGSRCNIGTDAVSCGDARFAPAYAEYEHVGGRCSLTGGHVYRGTAGTLPTGTYVFGDFCSGEILTLAGVEPAVLVDTALSISSFGEDEVGEIYVADHGSATSDGVVYRLARGVRLTPSRAAFEDAGGPGSVTVEAPAACSWSASASSPWLHVTSGSAGTGDGTVGYSVDANATGSARTAPLTIAGVAVPVSQSVVPSLRVGDLLLQESNAGSWPAAFSVTLSEPAAHTVTVQYATSDVTATAGVDYDGAGPGTLTFAPGETLARVPVAVRGDLLDENSEQFALTLSAPTGATLADATGIATITDDDPTPTITVSDASAFEGSTTHDFAFTATLSAPSGNITRVSWATEDGTALAGSDYVAKTGKVSLNPGTTVGTILVKVTGDNTPESNETFRLRLSNPTKATLANDTAVGTILDDDTVTPSLSVGNTSTAEGSSGAHDATFTVTLSAASPQTVKVNYTTTPDSAMSTDYSTRKATLSFPPGQTVATIAVPVVEDLSDEPDERFFLDLSAPLGATIASGRGEATIVDDDDPPVVSVGDAQVTEGNSGNVGLTFLVTLSVKSGFTIPVAYQTANGTAVAPADYTARTSSVTFSPGQTSKTAVITVKGDTLVEGAETLSLDLTSATNATLGDAHAVGTILDDDH